MLPSLLLGLPQQLRIPIPGVFPNTPFYKAAFLSLFFAASFFQNASAQPGCNNVINGGQIEANETGCPNPTWDPSPITSVTLPIGGTGNLEYVWIYTTDDPTLPGSHWVPIPNTNSISFDPGPISVTTHYRRCARRSGCTDYVGETNVVTKRALCCDIQIVGVQVVNVSCFGGSDGAVNLDILGGQLPFNYAWSPDLGNVEDPQNLAAGVYDVTVTDAQGCTATAQANVADGSFFTVSFNTANESCDGADNGAAIANVSGNGVLPYSFLWNDPAAQTSANANGLSPGAYIVTVTDDNGCTATGSAIINAGAPLAISTSTTPVLCAGGNTGSASVVNIGGGTAPFTYAWNDSALQTTATADNLVAGTYTVIVLDSLGCGGAGMATVVDGVPLVLTLSHTDAQCGDTDDGTATATVSGGVSPYAYQWDDTNNQTGATASSLGAGTYTVTVTDANGCSATGSVVVMAPMATQFNVTATDVSCFGGNNGTATISLINADPNDFTYRWNNPAGATTATATGLTAGNYTVTVTDTNGCSNTGSVTVSEPALLTAASQATNVTCFGGSNGLAVASASGGTLPYIYTWSAAGNPQGSILSNLAADTYIVTVTDANGCTASASATVGSPTQVVVNLTAVDVLCTGQANGSILSSVQGGTLPYAFLWNDPTQSVTSGLSNLATGSYSLTVTDAAGCTGVGNATVGEPAPLAINFLIDNVLCIDDTDGSVQAAVSGGISPYTFLWENGSPTPALLNLGTGFYIVTVTDANGCSVADQAEVTYTTNLSSTTSSTSANCYDAADGIAVASGINGTAPYSYIWNNGVANDTIAGLITGNYQVTVTDADGCSVTNSVFVSSPPLLTCQPYLVSAITLYGGTDGIAGVNVGGGVTPYSILWDNGSPNDTTFNLASGIHSVTVTDGNNCACVSHITLKDPSKIGNFVWNDINQNGIQEPGEPGLGSVAIHMSGNAATGGAVNLTTTSDANGFYAFDGLQTGFYKLTFDLLPNTLFTQKDIGNDALDSDVNSGTGDTDWFPIGEGYYEQTKDAGLIVLDEKVNIGDYVWLDVNQNGIQDLIEPGVPDIMVRLREMPSNAILATTTTNFLGRYLFADVMPGSYAVEFVMSSFPNGYIFSPKDAGTDDTKDSDADLTTGRTDVFSVFPFTLDNLTLDAGLHLECDNVTDGGLIGHDESLCGLGVIASTIVSLQAPTGGFGTLEYLWMKSFVPIWNGPGDPNWQPIPNSNSASYNPGAITQTTYYIRCSRRSGCDDYIGESNIVKKEVTPYPLTQITAAPSTLCMNEGGRFEAAIAGGGATYSWNFGNTANPQTAATRVVDGVFWTTQGLKTVTLTVTRLGCSFSATVNVNVTDCAIPIIVPDDFEAMLDEAVVHLSWRFDGDASNLVFFVQRAETDGIFRNLGAVMGEDRSGNGNFTFIDLSPRFGENRYRLHCKTTDNSAPSTFSEERNVFYQPASIVLVHAYPNPVAGKMTVELFKPNDSPVEVEVSNSYGHVVEQREFPGNTDKLELDFTNQPLGVYWIKIRQQGYREQVRKVVKTAR
jgi:hypothetical protein